MNSIDKEHLINCSEEIIEKSIYRVFEIEHLLEWFKTGKVAFCRPDKWEDPWEAFLFRKAFYFNKDNRGFIPYHKLCYAQCWTLNDKDSDLIWKLYSPNKNGVRVEISINKMYEQITSSNEFINYHHDFHKPECFMGLVEYLEKKEVKTPNQKIKKYLNNDIKTMNKCRIEKSIIEILFRKITEYTHENEFRIVFSTNNFDEICSNTPKLFHFTVNPFETIKEVLFDPRMDENLVNCYKTFLRSRYNFNKKIEQSSFIKIRGK